MEEAIQNHLGTLVVVAASAPPLLGAAVWAAIKYFAIARRYRNVIDLDRETEKKRNLVAQVETDYASKRSVYERLLDAIRVFEETIEAADYGLYSPHYDFDTAAEYKTKLNDIRDEQKKMIREKSAARCETDWSVEGSKRRGTAMVNRQIRLMLRAFNGECDATVQKVRWIDRCQDKSRQRSESEQLLSFLLDLTPMSVHHNSLANLRPVKPGEVRNPAGKKQMRQLTAPLSHR